MDTNKTKSPELLQSMTMTRSGVSFTKTQKQFMYEIIARVQSMYQGVKVKDAGIIPFDSLDAAATTFEIPIKDLLGSDNENYTHLKGSLQEMFYKLILVGDDDKGWSVRSFFDSIEIPERKGVIRARMTLTFFETMANLTNGLSVFDPHVAKGLPSSYTMKMYEFISRWDRNPPREVLIEDLRNVLGCNEHTKTKDGEVKVVRKFNTPGNLILLLNRIKKDLDDPQYHSPYSFDFEVKKEGRKIKSVVITVCKDECLISDSEKKKNFDAEHDSSLSQELHPALVDFMKQTMGWKEETIRKNLRTLKTFQKFYNPADMRFELSSLYARSRSEGIGNPVGYVINGLKGKLLQKGVKVNADGTFSIDEEKMKAFDSERKLQDMMEQMAKQMAGN